MGLNRFKNRLVQAKVCGVDSMIFIYLFEKNLRYYSLVKTIFDLAEQGKIELVTSVITPIEILSTSGLADKPSQIKLYLEFFKQMDNLTVADISWETVELSSSLRRKYGLRTPDAIQFATARVHNAPIFITNDKHFNRLKSDKIIQLGSLLNGSTL